ILEFVHEHTAVSLSQVASGLGVAPEEGGRTFQQILEGQDSLPPPMLPELKGGLPHETNDQGISVRLPADQQLGGRTLGIDEVVDGLLERLRLPGVRPSLLGDAEALAVADPQEGV